MKICVIGAGSIFFTRQMIKGMIDSGAFNGAEVALVDINPYKCEQMGRFCTKLIEENQADIKITYTTDRTEVLPGSDYVVLTFAIHNYHYRETGTNLARKFGIRLISGETTGPSGVLRIVRTVPEVLKVAKDVEKLCPKAMVINYVNPTNVIATALDRYTKVKWMAFCDGMYQDVFRKICRYTGLSKEVKNLDPFQLSIGGVNHFPWMWSLTYNGKDIWPAFKNGLKEASEADGISKLTRAEWELCDAFDAWPALSSHNVEYVRYFQGKGSDPSRDYCVKNWSLNERISWMRRVWWEIKQCNNGKMATKEITKDATEMIADILQSIEGDQGRRFPVNLRNEGRIANLPPETIVELFGTFGKNTIDVPGISNMPRGPLGLTLQIIDEQELALDAAMTGNFNTLVKAIASDPLVMSISDAKELAHNLLAIEEEDLPEIWGTYWKSKFGKE